MDNVGIIITARVNSSRLYQKVLQIINNKYSIDILIDHLVGNNKYPVIMAIPDDTENDILYNIAINRGIDVFRGFNDSPLHRITAAAEKYSLDYIARVTTDDILIDSRLLHNQINWAIKGNHEYVYMSKCPAGIAGEVIKTSALKDVIKKIGNKSIEFVSYELKNKYKTFEYYPGFEYQFKAKLTLDYEEDLQLIRILYSCLVNPGTLDIINFLKNNRWCLNINHVPAVTVYTCNYNTGPYIIDCMKSVLSQSFNDFEFIILDDCSQDNSMNIIIEYYSSLPIQIQKKIRVLRNEKNIGLPSSCNKVLAMARGQYIIRCDSDDRLNPDFLESTIERAKLDSTSAVFSGYNKTDEKFNTLETVLKNNWHPGCVLLSRWVVNEIKYRDGVEYCEGDYFFKDFRKNYTSSFIDKPLWDYRQRLGQKTQDPAHPLYAANFG